MFKAPQIEECLKNLLGWKNHYDLNDVPELPIQLNESESGEFYNDKHPALRLDNIQATLPSNRDLGEYLADKVRIGGSELVNQIIQERQFQGYAKEHLMKETLLNGYGWAKDKILKESRFVGMAITPKETEGLVFGIRKVGFQFVQPQTDLPIYVFHSSKVDPIHTFTITSTKGIQWHWHQLDLEIKAISDTYSGGSFIIGYYEDDLVGEAINFSNINWKTGFCGSCDGGIQQKKWQDYNRYFHSVPCYVPTGSVGIKGENFDFQDVQTIYDNNFGINLQVDVKCDISDFICSNRMSLKRAMYLKVAYLIMKDMQFSNQVNRIEEDLKMMIIRDLEGDKDTNYINIVDSLEKEIKGVNFDHSKVAQPCLPCTNAKAPKYNVI